jgi:hypothetical protein
LVQLRTYKLVTILRGKAPHVPKDPPRLAHVHLVPPHLLVLPRLAIYAVLFLGPHDIAVHLMPLIRSILVRLGTALIEVLRGFGKTERDDEWRDRLKAA